MSELKPCPFCGSPQVNIVTDCGVVECSRCNSYSCYVDVWNARAKGVEDKKTIIENHLNVLAECIKSVPVPEYGREHNIKMRDSILNVMASSIAACQVDLTHFDRMRIESKELDKKVESLDKFIKDNPIFGTLEWAEQSNMKRQLVSMISYASILKDRINLVAANREVEPSESKNIAVESLRQSIQDCEEFGRVYVELNGQWAKGHQQVTGVVVDDVGDIVIC